MEALQEGLDTLAHLEERITRAVQIISTLRSENSQLQEHLRESQQETSAARAELETLRGERTQVRTRLEKLLNQLDLLSAS